MGAPKILELNSAFASDTSDSEDVAQSIGIGEGLTPQQVVKFAIEGGFRHIVQRNGLSFDQEIKAARGMIEKPQKFFSQPLSAICGSAKFFEGRKFSSSYAAGTSKENALEDMTAFLDEQSATRRMNDRILLVADELFTNATRNAWEKPRFAADSNQQDFHAPVERPGRIEIFAHADLERLIVGCRDTYGLLNISNILQRLDACLMNGVSESIRRGPGGAGIGSYLVFESGVSYYAGVHQNQTTVVCVAFALKPANRDEVEAIKNLHLISI